MKFKTNKGIASFPSLEKTEIYQGKDTGYYKTKLILTPADAKPLIELCKEVAVDEYGPKKAAAASMPFKKNDDGNYVFAFKSKHKPPVYDAKGKVVTDELKIGSGSVLKIAGALKPKQGAQGVNAFLNAVMVVELKSWGGGNAFGAEDAEEGGFAAGSGFEDEDEAPKADAAEDDEF